MLYEKKNALVPSIVLFLVVVTLVVLVSWLRGNEDTWICSNGEWVKHGNPSAPKPTEKCPVTDAEGQEVEEAEETSLPRVPLGNSDKQNLRGQNLFNVPDTVINDSNLTELDLSDNSIESLPSQIEVWKNLRIFRIENNRVKSLAAEIRHWQKLTVLDASGNGMTNVPAEIGQLKNLKEIDFSDNSITEFPNEILNLTGLEKLDIRNNPVKADHLQRLRETLKNTTILY